jgi:hypothetical protein
MRFSEWSDGSMPVFLNPTHDEIVELVKSHPDTLRICEDDNNIAVASGYGNTHTSVIKVIRKNAIKDFFPLDLILFRETGRWLWNPLGHWDRVLTERVGFESGLRFLSDKTKEFVLEFVRIAEDQYRTTESNIIDFE